ncbi:MAG: ferrous iron transport protein B, partial [Thaumarchaeota archaeon]|nr:ferrous iron transport protein B [Nitrososphaerota archaeon]
IVQLLNPRWVAIKLLEGDEDVIKKLSEIEGGEEIIERGAKLREEMSRELGDPEVVIADARYAVIKDIVSRAVGELKRLTASDLLDHVLLDKYLGIPIFFVILWWWFQMAFIGSAPFCDILGDGFAALGEALTGITGHPFIDYLFFGEYGIIQGIGTVLSFVPLIMLLYFILALLEDSGYMARAAFVMEKAMRKVGLSGRSIIPMIMGFGCNVPAVYATRIIPEESDRLVAILTNPLMLCGARLIFFSAIASAFYGAYAGDILFSLYALGVVLAFMVAIILRKTFFRGRVSPFVLELPAYQKPSFKVAAVRMWDRGSMYLRKALGIILIGLLIIGVLTATDAETLTFTTDPERSLVAALGRSLAPIFTPLNWDWRFVVAMIFGFVAKEIVLGASAMLYGAGEEEIASRLASLYNPIDMYGYMTFILIYIPCIATIAAIRQETRSWKWTVFTVVYGLILAYIVNLLIVTLGHLLLG